ncbi:hypothetical protein Tco_0630885, partial [Tanacetum coccineum]
SEEKEIGWGGISKEAGERGISEDLGARGDWTTGGGTLMVLSVSTWSMIVFGSHSTSLEEEERGGRTEGPSKIIPPRVVIALISALGLDVVLLCNAP